jgi:MoaA/NifB/PqqE/SkfB family radical SAM enzyme
VKKTRRTLEVGPDGSLSLPPDLVRRWGLELGTQLVIEEGRHDLRLLPPVSNLRRVYVEVTNTCSLGCRTCIRNVWDEQPGWLSLHTWERIIEGLTQFPARPEVFFGGFGEPLSHPHIVDMILQAKALGCRVELITSGVHLTPEMSTRLIDAELDLLWVSLDGVSPESYADVRLGAELGAVLENLKELVRQRDRRYREKPHLGVAFVALQRNIAGLPQLLRLGARLGVKHFSISNVLAHTPELHTERLYARAMYDGAYQASSSLPQVSFPRMDMQEATQAALAEILSQRYQAELSGSELARTINRCPFIHKGSTSIRWDGSVSPCLPLLHTHHSYLDARLRRSQEYLVGSLHRSSLAEIWHDPAYSALRQRLQDFDFSPCTFCNSCEMADGNQEDCFGNSAPACGGCLWAQGLIQCP